MGVTRRELIGYGACAATIPLIGCKKNAGGTRQALSLRLGWFPQAEFAGYILAAKLGHYAAEGLDVELRPGGPDIRAHLTVANGSDDLGIAPSSQIVLARSNSVPLKIIAQPVQDSIFRFVLKAKNRIGSLRELTGKTIGLWLGGDEAEFVAMCKSHGLSLSDFKVIPQDYTVVAFLEDRYVLSEVTVLNELIQIQNEGYTGDKLQIISPAQFGVAMPSDSLFCHERLLTSQPDLLRKFVRASVRGWLEAFRDKPRAVQILVSAYPDLKKDHQLAQLNAMEELCRTQGPFGGMTLSAYQTVQDVLLASGQLKSKVSASGVFDPSFLPAA